MCGCQKVVDAQGATRLIYADPQTGLTHGLIWAVSGMPESDGDMEVNALTLRSLGFKQDTKGHGCFFHPKYFYDRTPEETGGVELNANNQSPGAAK